MEIIEWIILGVVQGLTEWLPVSSEGMSLLVITNIFHSDYSFEQMVGISLFLHMGTFLAALVYFRRDVAIMARTLLAYKTSASPDRKTLVFLVVTTCVSGILGFALLKVARQFDSAFSASGSAINIAIGVLLLVTAYLQIKAEKGGAETEENLSFADHALLGFAQGISVLPGLSRSGLTVSALLLRGFSEPVCLRLSFLMSLPIVLAGNVLMNLTPERLGLEGLALTSGCFAGIAVSFVTGIISIALLMRLCARFNFGFLLFLFGTLLILSALVG